MAERQVSAETIATVLGCHPETIRRWRRGEVAPSTTHAIELEPATAQIERAAGVDDPRGLAASTWAQRST